jgi:uncharacterized membrane protein
MEDPMTLFETLFVALVVAAFSLYLLVLFAAWLLVTVIPSKEDKKARAQSAAGAASERLAA